VEAKVSDDAQDFPSVDAEQTRALLAVVYQGIRECLALNARLAAALPEGQNQEAHRLNDAMFVALNDMRQRLEQVIRSAP
jgi:hypothetical protein